MYKKKIKKRAINLEYFLKYFLKVFEVRHRRMHHLIRTG